MQKRADADSGEIWSQVPYQTCHWVIISGVIWVSFAVLKGEFSSRILCPVNSSCLSFLLVSILLSYFVDRTGRWEMLQAVRAHVPSLGSCCPTAAWGPLSENHFFIYFVCWVDWSVISGGKISPDPIPPSWLDTKVRHVGFPHGHKWVRQTTLCISRTEQSKHLKSPRVSGPRARFTLCEQWRVCSCQAPHSCRPPPERSSFL